MVASALHCPGGWAPAETAMGGWIRSVQADPRFETVLARAVEELLSVYRARGWLSRIFADRGHLVGGWIALYLHHVPHFGADKPGLTVGRFQALCRALGVCSPGRAAALLSLMRFARFLEAEEVAGDRRVRRLVPTDRLLAYQWQRWSCFLPGAALALGAPAGELLPRLHAREDMVAAMVRRIGWRFLDGFRLLHHAPELAPMAECDGGIQLLSLFYASAAAGGGWRKDRAPVPVPVSVSACAGALGASRAHVRKLLRIATEAGLLTQAAGGGAVLVGEALAAPLHGFYAAIFVLLADAVLDAGPTSRATGPCRRRTPRRSQPPPRCAASTFEGAAGR